MALSFINDDSEEYFNNQKVFYKYMKLSDALKSLKKDKKKEEPYLWFANPMEWKDPYEKRFINAKYDNKSIEFLFKEKILCYCLAEPKENEAQWKAYNENELAVRFTIYREKLYEILDVSSNKLDVFSNKNDYNIYIGKVKYISAKTIKTNDLSKIFDFSLNFNEEKGILNLLLLKRNDFKYEAETRVIIVKDNADKKGEKLFYDTIEPKELIKEITLDPNIDDNLCEILKQHFKTKYDINAEKSKLYKDLKHPVTIKM